MLWLISSDPDEMTQYIALHVLISLLAIASAEELTFELPDNEKMCFYEEMEAGVKTTLEFQVRRYSSPTLNPTGQQDDRSFSLLSLSVHLILKTYD